MQVRVLDFRTGLGYLVHFKGKLQEVLCCERLAFLDLDPLPGGLFLHRCSEKGLLSPSSWHPLGWDRVVFWYRHANQSWLLPR